MSGRREQPKFKTKQRTNRIYFVRRNKVPEIRFKPCPQLRLIAEIAIVASMDRA